MKAKDHTGWAAGSKAQQSLITNEAKAFEGKCKPEVEAVHSHDAVTWPAPSL